MPLTLRVDEQRWCAHLRDVVRRHPGVVPVAKGNGYGFGVRRLAGLVSALGSEMLAVGTYDELSQVRGQFGDDLLVLSPWRPFLPGAPADDRVVHTIGRPADLPALARLGGRPRVLLEGLTSMRRHGLTPAQMAGLDRSGVRVEGLALHLSPQCDHLSQVESWLALERWRRVFVSYLTERELAELSARHPGVELRPRAGTGLWLGDRGALSVTSTVLDVHAVRRGERAGYRQRWVPTDGHLVVVAGGTAHGVGLRAPTAGPTMRDRAAALAKGGLEAAGLALSPFRIGGRQRWFLEPPHMQVSLLIVPAGTSPPSVGEEIPVESRFTTTIFDRVVTTEGVELSHSAASAAEICGTAWNPRNPSNPRNASETAAADARSR
ncbi:MAG: alanine racemase [Geodermatophilaceae bacterium]|nr:alanine racemase [Geodermatophilaceae bacterium]MDQ3463196.1 alanine racemase [Actinomycetota bacterium]